ncbi:MAG TPA: alpha-L-rhamnosidase C-terminal domain-containing protein, partial [Bacteroidales bacterium]|nr:alpha-L-rhamnosidase C-terminal domain-containing protein [Bacteroidales bacterium]
FSICGDNIYSKELKYSGKIERTYISPLRIVWQSAHSKIINAESLLENGIHQASLINSDVCILGNQDKNASVVLDFGKEIHGGLEIVTGMSPSNQPVRVRIRFGESVSEAMAETNEKTGATNDHAIRDWRIELPWLGKIEIGNTGFRFVRIDLLEDDSDLHLKEVNAISVMRDIPYLGSFRSSDSRLNKIWDTGAYTVHLNMQEYLWDGIKRDRLVWVGDMHPEVMTILSVFGDNEVVPKSLDFIAEITPSDQWMNGISSYSMWWLLIHHQYYMNTGNIEYLRENKKYIFELLAKLESKIDENGKEMLDGNRFLDWPTSEDQKAIHAGLQSMMVMTFNAAKEIAGFLDESRKAKHYDNVLKKLNAYKFEIPTRKSPGALMVLAGIADAKTVNDQLLTEGGVKDMSTFYGYYVLNAMAKAGNIQGAMEFIDEYWGGMLDLGATTFWEDFNIEWKENAGRIDEVVAKDKVDVHATYGDYCYQKFRHSLCHGWASGPTAWLSQYVLGINIVAPGCKVVKINPYLGKLDWVEGTYPTPKGTIRVRHEKQTNGTIISDVKMPHGIKLIKGANIMLLRQTN